MVVEAWKRGSLALNTAERTFIICCCKCLTTALALSAFSIALQPSSLPSIPAPRRSTSLAVHCEVHQLTVVSDLSIPRSSPTNLQRQWQRRPNYGHSDKRHVDVRRRRHLAILPSHPPPLMSRCRHLCAPRSISESTDVDGSSAPGSPPPSSTSKATARSCRLSLWP